MFAALHTPSPQEVSIASQLPLFWQHVTPPWPVWPAQTGSAQSVKLFESSSIPLLHISAVFMHEQLPRHMSIVEALLSLQSLFWSQAAPHSKLSTPSALSLSVQYEFSIAQEYTLHVPEPSHVSWPSAG